MSKSSLALSNLRAVVILIVLAFHSVLAYLDFLPAKPYPFDVPPYKWQAFPIIDSQRWMGFDLFCAWQDVYLMSFMFFLSGLFVWPSLMRKGSGRFLTDRLRRIGVPLIVVVLLVMPIAYYPTYRVSATDPGMAAYWQALL
ncbi:MAG: acyltransferase family protein, partial [Pseudorhodoplanes sp.]